MGDKASSSLTFKKTFKEIMAEKDSADDSLFSMIDSTMLLISRAIGIGFLYFPSHITWQTFFYGNSFAFTPYSLNDDGV